MTDDERAELLARAIDDLIRGIESPDTSHGLDDEELDALRKVAQDRLETGRALQAEGETYEAEVWDALKDRLAAQTSPAPDVDIPGDHHEALRDIISLRMQMAREVFEIAESHRDEVWHRLQSRVGSALPDRKTTPTADETPIEPRNEADIEAITRRSLARLAEIASDPVHNRFRERLKRDVQASVSYPMPVLEHDSWPSLRTILAGAVVIALVALAIGPLPLTGLDGHPAVQFAETVANHTGLTQAEGATAASP